MLVAADRKTRALLLATGRRVEEVEHNQIVDLSDAGERWEGDVLNDAPCGWGVVYDRNNRMEYEGFRIGDVNVCWGRKYYSDIEVVEYEGEWCAGQRCGRGVQCDRNNDVLVDGEWLKGERVEAKVTITPHNEKTVLLHNHIEELIVSNGCCNGEEWNVMDLKLMPALKSLNVGDDCFSRVNELRIVGLRELESVVIGVNCFTHNEYEPDPNRHFSVKKCPKLRELRMGQFSFSYYSVIEIENVDALEVIEMGDLNEVSVNFALASLELKSVLIYNE